MSSVLFASLLVVCPSHTSGQQVAPGPSGPDNMGRIVARLIDAQSGSPVTQALLTLRTLDRRALSDSTGTATFMDLAPGAHELVVRHIGYGEQTLTVDVESMVTVIIGVELTPEAVAVAPLNVLIESRPRFLEDKGFYARRAHGVGRYFDPQFVERWNVGTWARADEFVGLIKNMVPRFHGSLLCGGPVTYVDGRRVFDDNGQLGGRPSSELSMMSTYTIGAVEVYSDGFGSPDFALSPDAACGVIVIWTNRWRGRTRELGGADVDLCEPRDPSASTVEGTIRDEFTDVLLPGAHVFVTTYPAGNTRAAITREIISDKNARYRVCDVPEGNTLTIKASTAERSTDEVFVPVEAAYVEYDLAIRLAGPGAVVGRVLGLQTGDPVVAADVRVVGAAARVQTDELGFFSLTDVRPGDYEIEVNHLSFEAITQPVSIVADRTVEMSVSMSADPIELAPIVVTALRDRRLERRGYYERRTRGDRTGQGQFLGAEAIDRRGAATTTSLLGDVAGVRVSCSGRNCVVGSSRGADCRRMNVYLNGTLALRESRGNAISLDELVRPSEIEAVEVYPGASSTPAEFLDGRCGAVVIWTR